MERPHNTPHQQSAAGLTRIRAALLHGSLHAACLGAAGVAVFAAANSGSHVAELRSVIGEQRAQIRSLTEIAASTRDGIDGISRGLAQAAADHAATIGSATAAASRSVYMIGAVGADGTGWQQIGTAWVVKNAARATSDSGDVTGPLECDALATNAHVVDSIAKAADDGLSVVARLPGVCPVDLPVLAARAHPGWKWAAGLADCPLMQVRADGEIAQRMLVPAADVGLVYVEAGSAAPALRLASSEQLRDLQAGEAVGIVGYPSESMAGPRENHVAQMLAGQVTALTSAFHQPVDADSITLIHHNLPMGGGSSGSPIVDRHGRVIGVHSAGNVAQGAKGRIPIGTGYAQRADLVVEMLDGGAEAHQQARQLAWSRELRRVSPSPETLLSAMQKSILSRMTAKAGLDHADGASDSTLAVEQQYTASATEQVSGSSDMRATERTIVVRKGETYAFLAVGGPLSTDVDVAVYRDKKLVASDTAPDPLPVVLWSADEDGVVRLVVSERTSGLVDEIADRLTIRVLRVGGL